MLKKILKLALFLAPFTMMACGNDSSTVAVSPQKDIVVQKDSVIVDTIIADGDTIIKVDTIQTVDTVKVPSVEKAPYYVENTDFNWDNLQDVSTPVLDINGVVVPSSSSSEKISSSSSSSSYVNLISSSSETPSTVNGGILTDGRDGQTYKVENVGGALWMVENIKFKTKTGYFCYDGDCSENGVLYTYAALSSVCPKGWHLPSRAEMETLQELGAEWEYWQFGGRMSGSDYSYKDDMGFWWISKNSEYQTGDDRNCKTDACGMLFVQKAPSYGSGENKFQQDDQSKGFSVRCVQD